MRVDNVGQPGLPVQPVEQIVGKYIQIVPQLFFGNIGIGAGIDAHDRRLLAEVLPEPAVIRIDVVCDDPSGDQVDALHMIELRQRPGEVDDILDLPAGIRITPQFEVGTTNQAVDADQQGVQQGRIDISHRLGIVF